MSNMSEREVAADLQRTAGDASEWGDAEPAPAEVRTDKRRLAAMVSVRLAPDELAALQEHARGLGVTVSAFLRSVALREIQAATPVYPSAAFRVRDASVGVSSFKTTSQFVHAQVVTHVGGASALWQDASA